MAVSFASQTAHFGESHRAGRRRRPQRPGCPSRGSGQARGYERQRNCLFYDRKGNIDAGVYRALRPRGPLDSADEIDGAAIETLVLETLRAEVANRGLAYQLHCWRTFDGKEVDFVLYGERGLHAIEVKRSSRFREPDLASLRVFCADYPEAKAYLLYGGRQRYRFGNIDVVPLGEGLGEMGERLA